MQPGDTILVLNAGSSSIKFQLFAVSPGDRLDRQLKGAMDAAGGGTRLTAADRDGARLIDERWPAESLAAAPATLTRLMDLLAQRGGAPPVAVGHRVVHGGLAYVEPTLVTAAVLAALDRLVPLAPLHQPGSLAPIRLIRERHPGLPQVACFDTAFHRGQAEVAERFAIPEPLYAEGVRRYGFHGLSYEYIAGRLGEVAPELAGGRVAVAHLGNGASMCALRAGRSVESTMSFTALDGLPMGTRPGQLDPGVVLHLLHEKGMSAAEIEHWLYHECGLKALSGLSSDVRELLGSADPRARLALDYLVYRIVLQTGLLAAAMGGIDGFVFTAGIGENAPAIRAAVLQKLAWLGFDLDEEANARGGPRITSAGSRAAGYVVPTDEELMIARHTLRVVRGRHAEAT